MTTDPFTTAARVRANGQWPMQEERHAFVTGAVWARDHLAAQEPTDPTPLQEAIARALYEQAATRPDWDKLGPKSRNYWREEPAAAVLPLIAAEVRKAQADALRDAADSVHDNAASPYCLPCHRDDADLLRTIAATIEQED